MQYIYNDSKLQLKPKISKNHALLLLDKLKILKL